MEVADGGAVDAYNKWHAECLQCKGRGPYLTVCSFVCIPRKSPEGYRIQEGDLVVKVNGVNVS